MLTFDHAKGLKTCDGQKPLGFAVAGPSRLEARGTLTTRRSDALLAALRERLPNIYAQHVAGLDEIDVALSALRHGEQLFGPLPPAATVVHDKMVKAILVELDEPRLEVEWVDGVGAQLSRLAESFPRSSALSLLQIEYMDWLEVQLLASLEKDAFLFAESAVAALTPIMFDAETLDRLSRKVADAEVEFAVATQQRLSQDNARSFANALTRALSRSCLYLDVNQVGSLLREWVARDASLEAQGRKRIAERLGHCMGQLAELDDDRAQVLRDKARAEFGPMPELDTRREKAGEMS